MGKGAWAGEMPVIYIAGPYRAADAWEVQRNIHRAAEVALQVWQWGGVALCPHRNTANFDGACPDEVWLSGGLELLRRCDAIALVPEWTESEGTCAEIAEANDRGLPIFSMSDEKERASLEMFIRYPKAWARECRDPQIRGTQ